MWLFFHSILFENKIPTSVAMGGIAETNGKHLAALGRGASWPKEIVNLLKINP